MRIRFTKYRNAGLPTLATIVAAGLIAACIAMGMAPIFVALFGIAIGVFFTSFIINSKQEKGYKGLRSSLLHMLSAAVFAGLVASCLVLFAPVSLILLAGISAGAFLAAFFIIRRYNNASEDDSGFGWLVKNLFLAAIILGLGVGLIFVASMVSVPLALAISFAASCAFTAHFYTNIGKPTSTKAKLLAIALLLIAPAAVIAIGTLAIGLAMPAAIALGIATATVGGVCLAAWKTPYATLNAHTTKNEHETAPSTSSAASPVAESIAERDLSDICSVVYDVLASIGTGISDIYNGRPSSRGSM